MFRHYFPNASICWTSLVAQMVKRLSTMRETWVRSLGREDPLEKAMAIHSSTIVWKIPWTGEPGWLQSMGSQRVRHDWATSLFHMLLWLMHRNTFKCITKFVENYNIVHFSQSTDTQSITAITSRCIPLCIIKTGLS